MGTTAALAGAAMLLAQAAPAAGAPVIDNERVTVWDVTLRQGEAAPLPGELDAVVMVLQGGRFRLAGAGGRPAVVARKAGQAVFASHGGDPLGVLVSEGPAHLVVVALKDHEAAKIPPAADLPAAFPRPGAVKRLENARAVVWSYAWRPGFTPMHFHDKDVVIAYRTGGAIDSIARDGQRTGNVYRAGEIRFNPARRIHSEHLVGGRPSAVILELK